MTGLKRHTASLFSNTGKLFVLAMDHAQGGIIPGLEKPYDLAMQHAGSLLDGYLINVGIAPIMAEESLLLCHR